MCIDHHAELLLYTTIVLAIDFVQRTTLYYYRVFQHQDVKNQKKPTLCAWADDYRKHGNVV